MPSQDYPDINITELTRDSIAQYLFNEIGSALSDRQEIQQLWSDIQKLYEQIDVPEKKDYPFEGAAHVMIPVIATYTEQVHARLMDTLHAGNDPYSCVPTRDDLSKYAKSMRKWLRWASKNELMEEETDYGLIMELLKLGTAACKTIYTRQDRTLFRYNEALKKYEPIVERMIDNPEYIHIALPDYIFPSYARSQREAEWEDHRFRITWNEIKRRAEAGIYKREAVEHIRHWYETKLPDYEEDRARETRLEPSTLVEFELHDVWFEYPIELKKDEQAPIDETSNVLNFGTPVGLCGIFHKDSRTFLRLQYNWYPLGLTPFDVVPYVGREHQILGIGIGLMALPFQIEVSAMHNQRLDNATVVNAVAYKYKADSRVPDQLFLRPGGGIAVDEMEDLEPFALGSKADSTIEAEKTTLMMLQERVGVREMALDDVALSKAPATTTLVMLQEKGRRLDNVLRGLRKFKKRVILKSVLLYKAYYPKDKLRNILGEEDGGRVIEVLALPDQTIWDSMGIEVAATTSSTSQALSRIHKLELFNVLLTYYDKSAQYVMAVTNPMVPPQIQAMALKIMGGMSTFIDELLEQTGVHGRSDYILEIPQPSPPPVLGPGGTPASPGAVQSGNVQAPSENGGGQGASRTTQGAGSQNG